MIRIISSFLPIILFGLQSALCTPQPNVLFIAIDDLNDWVGCLGGHPDVKTPNIDRLAERGILFTNAHCVSPICGPSRASVLTGRRPETTGVYHNKGSYLDYVGEDVVPLPLNLRQNGYVSLGAGKINHAFTKVDDRNWDHYGPSSGHIGGPFTEEELSTQGPDYPGRKIKRGKLDVVLPMNGISTLIDRPGNTASTFDWGPVALADSEMPDGQVADWGVEQLGRDHEKPFFLAVGIYRPHQPMFAPRKYFDLYDPKTIALPRTSAGDLQDVPEAGRDLALKGWTSGCHHTVIEHNQWREGVQGYLASISFADALAGKVIDALDASPHADNTLIILWSDHGWHLGEKNHWGKHTPWARATRIPLVIVPPKSWKTPAGVKNDSPISLLDLYPTIIDVCGLPKAAELDGKSLTPILKKPETVRTDPAVVTIGRGTHAVVDREWRYIRWFDGSQELYDLSSDPDEYFNLAGEADHAEEIRRLAGFIPEDQRFKRFARAGRYKAVEKADNTLMVFDFEAPGGISEQTDIAVDRPEIAEKIRSHWRPSRSRRSNLGSLENPRNTSWETLPDLPPAVDQKTQPGLAGPFTGVLDGALVVAGGANFPDGYPWEGGSKAWHDDVFIFEPGDRQWRRDPDWKLPAKIAYGGSAETEDGLILIGGLENGTPTDSVRLIRRTPEGNLVFDSLPDLPNPVGDGGTTRWNKQVYVVGGITDANPVSNSVFVFDIENRTWSDLPPIPGPARKQPVVACQKRNGNPGLYVFSGSTVADDGRLRLLTDAWFFDFESKIWDQLPDIEISNLTPGETNALGAATAVPWGDEGVLVFSGSGSDFLLGRLEILNESIRSAADGDEERSSILARQQMIVMSRQPTFRTGIHLYSPEKGWLRVGSIPAPGTVTTRAFQWQGGIVLPTGEIRPGVRTPRVIWAPDPEALIDLDR